MDRINQSLPWKKTNESTSPKNNDSTESHSTGDSKQANDLQQPWKGADNNNSSDAANEDISKGFHPWPSPPKPRSFFLPLHYVPTYQYPVVVWFHHDGCNENQVDQIMPHLSTRNYIGIGIRGNHASDSSGHLFGWHDSPAAIDATQDAVSEALIDASSRFSIHPSRVVLAGYQSGGTMALQVALRAPNQFAGVISLGGTMPHRGITLFNELRLRRLPMLWQWSANNPLYNEENLRADCQLAMSISAQVEIRQYADEDEMNTVTLKDTNGWIMRTVISDSRISDNKHWSSQAVAYSEN